MSETPGNLAAALDEIRERAKGPMRSFRDVDNSQADVPRLLAAVDEVLAFHQPEESRQGTVCGYCDDSYGEHAEWPCETYQAITRALLGEEGGDA